MASCLHRIVVIGRNGTAGKTSSQIMFLRAARTRGSEGPATAHCGPRFSEIGGAASEDAANQGSEPSVSRQGSRVEQAVRDHLTLIWQVLRRSGLQGSDADDAAQDVFWVFAQRENDVTEVCTRSFLVATALRIASDRRRSKWNRSVTESIEDDSFAECSAAPDERLQTQRRIRLLDRVLSAMDPEEREIFILFQIEEMTRTEVARTLGIPEGTAASRLRRAKESFERLVMRSQTKREHANV